MSLDMLGSAVVSSGELNIPCAPYNLSHSRDDRCVTELDAGLCELPPPQPAPGHGLDVPGPLR